jgi:2'-5' RNA ligase
MMDSMANKHLYLLALEVVPLKVGKAYDVLPSHCTLVHRFWCELDSTQLTEKLQPIFDDTESVMLTFEGKEVFGPPPVTVNRLLETPELKALHMNLYKRLGQLNVEYTAPQWVGEGFKAHVTERSGVSFDKGYEHISDVAYLIEVKVPENEDARFVRARLAFKSEK